jgi:hypothetical protein
MAHRTVTPAWGEVLWAHFDHLTPPEKIRLTGAWIGYITHTLLPELGEARRVAIADLLEDPDWDPQRVAETIGSRKDAVRRLAKEGRKLRGKASDDSSA